MKPLITIAVVLALQNLVDFTNPQTVILLRVAFGLFSIALYFMWRDIVAKVVAKNDTRRIWVKKASAAPGLGALFGGGQADPNAPVEYEETTYLELEKKKAEAQLQQALSGPIMQLGLFSFMLNIQLPLAIGLVTTPLNLLTEDPLVKQYFLGQTLEKPYGELLEDPTNGAAAAAAAAAADAAAAPEALSSSASGSASASASADEDSALEAFILDTWDNKEPVAPATLQGLADAGKPIATYKTSVDKQTALMVLSGGPHHSKAAITKLLSLGADPAATDIEGWNCLCWAAFHNNPKAVEAVADYLLLTKGEESGKRQLKALLEHKPSGGSNPGLNAVELAKAQGSDAAAAAFKAAQERLAPAPAAAAAAKRTSPSPSRKAAAAAPAPAPAEEKEEKAAKQESAAAAEEEEEEEEEAPAARAGARRRRQQA